MDWVPNEVVIGSHESLIVARTENRESVFFVARNKKMSTSITGMAFPTEIIVPSRVKLRGAFGIDVRM